MYVTIWMNYSDFVSLCKENTVKIRGDSSLHNVKFSKVKASEAIEKCV